MKSYHTFFWLIGLLLLQACSTNQTARREVEPIQLAVNGNSATGPYLTKNHEGQVVLCWTEMDGVDSLNRLRYAVYDSLKNTFGDPVTISVSAGCSTSAESMGKVAFKPDGTVIAVFAKSFPNEKNRFAGAIYYSFSKDDGRNWSPATFLHSDTSHAYGRNFFDVAALQEGEVAAIWLDGRFGKRIKGSALYFSRTQEGGGFGKDTCLLKGTCECCRTDLLQDEQGRLHLALRDIMEPSELSAHSNQVRDMVYMQSSDNGKTFSEPQTISKDNWEIDGCPHSGPSMAIAKGQLNAVWFTAGGSPGIYSTSAAVNGRDFQPRRLISRAGRHPQMIALPNGTLAMVCEEPVEAGHDKNAHQHMGGHQSTVGAKIVLRYLSSGQVLQEKSLSDGQSADSHAVLTAVDNDRIMLAWVRQTSANSKIYYMLTDSKIN